MHTSFNNRGSWWANAILVLFVLIIIVVLYPVFCPPSNYCRKSVCTNNIKEMAVALQLYWNDYNGKLPSSMLVNHSKKWNKADFLQFGTRVGQLPPNDAPKTCDELLYKYIKEEDRLFCPSDPNKDESDPNRYASYWWKLAADKAWYGVGCKKRYQNEKDYAYNADQIILFERTNFHDDTTVGLRNDTQINVTFIDSHVKSITIHNATSGDPINCAANADGEPMYYNCDPTTYDPNKGLSDKKTPTKFVDPGVYIDQF